MKKHASWLTAIAGVLVLLLVITSIFWFSHRRARSLVEVAIESVIHSLPEPPAVIYIVSQDPNYVEAISKKKALVGARIEFLALWPNDRVMNANWPSHPIEMRLVIAAIESKRSDEADMVISYHFGPNNGRILRLSATRGLFGWKIDHTEIEKEF